MQNFFEIFKNSCIFGVFSIRKLSAPDRLAFKLCLRHRDEKRVAVLLALARRNVFWCGQNPCGKVPLVSLLHGCATDRTKYFQKMNDNKLLQVVLYE